MRCCCNAVAVAAQLRLRRSCGCGAVAVAARRNWRQMAARHDQNEPDTLCGCPVFLFQRGWAVRGSLQPPRAADGSFTSQAHPLGCELASSLGRPARTEQAADAGFGGSGCWQNRSRSDRQPAAERTGLLSSSARLQPSARGAAAGCRRLRRRIYSKTPRRRPAAAGCRPNEPKQCHGLPVSEIDPAGIGGPQLPGGGGPLLASACASLRKLRPELRFVPKSTCAPQAASRTETYSPARPGTSFNSEF